MSPRECSVGGCTKTPIARTYCTLHYQRWRKYGSPLVRVQFQGDDLERFWSKVRSDDDPLSCWVWIDAVDKDGYGKFRLGRASVRAHRMAWELLRGEIPIFNGKTLVLDHECSNPPCVNPWHLDPVTPAVNSRRAAPHLDENRCIRNHELTEENTRVNRKGYRICRECMRVARRL